MFKMNKRVPLSNYELQRRVTNYWQELCRAREHYNDLRALMYEDHMNAALDALCDRYRGRN